MGEGDDLIATSQRAIRPQLDSVISSSFYVSEASYSDSFPQFIVPLEVPNLNDNLLQAYPQI